jgi:hypothetical protein
MSTEDSTTPALIEGPQPAEFIEYDFGVADTGTDQIAVLFRLTDGPWKGREATWFGTFTEAALQYTLEALANVGWDGRDVRQMREQMKKGTRVSLVFQIETYNSEERSRPRFINKAGIRFKNGPMTKDQRNGFLRELQTRLDGGVKATGGKPFVSHKPGTGDDDIPL